MNILSQIIQTLPIYRIFFLILLIPIIIYPITPFITTYIFRPLLYLSKILYRNYAYFFVYDFNTKKPICCALISITTQNNKKYLTITNKQGIAYFLPKNKHKNYIKIYHPLYEPPAFNTTQIKDNVFIKKMPNTYIYLSNEHGVAFPLLKRNNIKTQILTLLFKFIFITYFIIFTLFYFWTIFLFLNNLSIFNFIIFILISLLYKIYIEHILKTNKNIYPNTHFGKIVKTPFTIKNILNNQDIAIVNKIKIPIILEKGHYQIQINNASIPLKLKKIGALYFVEDKV